jgi:NADH-quinone oxidoreductase subunit F
METPLTKNIRPQGEPPDLKAYENAGGYQAARKALRMAPVKITELVTQSGLRGRGGAGFPTGKKWSIVPMGKEAPHPKYLIANADEMEPGTFKDRLLLEGDPHQLIEGMIISGHAIEADVAYVFVRGEYVLSAQRLAKAIHEAYENRYLGKNIFGSGYNLEMYVHVSAGRYMCGEETGLLNALEGKRANPRAKPPFPQVSGVWANPQSSRTSRLSATFRTLSRTARNGLRV